MAVPGGPGWRRSHTVQQKKRWILCGSFAHALVEEAYAFLVFLLEFAFFTLILHKLHLFLFLTYRELTLAVRKDLLLGHHGSCVERGIGGDGLAALLMLGTGAASSLPLVMVVKIS